MLEFNPVNTASRPLDKLREPHNDLGFYATDEISILDLLIAAVRDRKRIFKTTIILGIIGVILALVLPVRYTATTTLLPPQSQNSVGASALMSQLGGMGSMAALAGSSLGLKNPTDLQIGLMMSRTVEDAVIDRFHLMDRDHIKLRSRARKTLESHIKIRANSKDGLIVIAATDKNPQMASDLANGYVEEFQRFSATLAVTEASQRRLFFERQLTKAKDNLADAEESLKETEQKTGMIELDSQARAAIQLVADLRAQIAAKEVQISGMRSFAARENPELQLAEEELDSLKRQEESLGAKTEGQDTLMLPKGNLQASGLEYVRKLRDVKYHETIFNLLARQYEIAKVDEAKQGTSLQVVDSAEVPDHKSFPMRTLIVLGSLLLGCLIGIGRTIIEEALRGLARDPVERTRLETLRALLTRRKSGQITSAMH